MHSFFKKSLALTVLSLLLLSFGLFAGSESVYAQSPEEELCITVQNGKYDRASGTCKAFDENNKELSNIGQIFSTISTVLVFIVGAVSVVMLIIGGFRYTVSGGDQNAVAGAKNTIIYAVVGIVVAFLAYAAILFVIGRLESSTKVTPTTPQQGVLTPESKDPPQLR